MSDQEPQPRVVVTGVGAITAQGPTADALWEGVKAGRVAIRTVEHLSMEGLRTTLGGEVKERVLPDHDYRRPEDFRDPVIDFAMKAAEEAIEATGAVDSIPPERWGVVVGTCNAGLLSAERWYVDYTSGKDADPRLSMLVTPQALAEALSGAFDVKGPVLSVNTACAASANAIGYAAELIRTNQADAVITGGSDAFSDVLYAGFNSLESLSPAPAAPYSKDRQGLSLGEGSGMLVLMREDIARQAGLPMLAEVLGYGLSADGYHATAPHPEGQGAGRAIKAALAAAGVDPAEVRYVNSHGTGTAKNDPAETKATKVGLGAAASTVAVSSTKSMIGHLLGAAGAVENIVTIKALYEQVAPPTANFTEPDPECDLDYVPNQARPLAMDVAISNNFAFGGANAVVALGKVGARAARADRAELDRVVVTGIGTLTCAGNDPAALVSAVSSGQRKVEAGDAGWVGRVDLDPSAFLSAKERRRVDRLGLFSVIATKQALADAGLDVTDANRERIGVILGTGVGPMESMESFAAPVIEEGASGANPAVFPNTVYNAAGGQVAMLVGAVGPASTVTAGHAAGASSICYAFDLAAANQADVMVAIGADTLTDTVIEAYRSLGLLAAADAEPGAAAGFALAEAGVALILERQAAAVARGARVYGEVLGYAITSDARGVGAVDGEGHGVERAMRLALERSGRGPDEVVAVWTSASGYGYADAAEDAAIRRVFGDRSDLALVSPKGLLGEPIGAGASVAMAALLAAWQQGSHHFPRGPVVVNSLSLGGTNISIVLAPPAG